MIYTYLFNSEIKAYRHGTLKKNSIIKKQIPNLLSTKMRNGESSTENQHSRRNLIKILSASGALVQNLAFVKNSNAEEKKHWEQVSLPTDSVLFDLDFVKDSPDHGWMVGTKGTVLETVDGGKSWVPRTFANLDPDEELTYRFENISFFGNDGWIVGKPSILLHTKDGGNSWVRVPVSPKLPGNPILIVALGVDSAEMTTSSGAIYVTDNGGRSWKAQVKETIDSTLNRTISSGVSGASYFTGSVIGVTRDAKGKYLAISSRGNFFLTWQPGQEFWLPRARDTSRRIQSMGFVQNDSAKGIWMSIRGGGLSITKENPQIDSANAFEFSSTSIKTGGYGILDVAFRNDDEIWASCGGGNLYYSLDKGNTWKKEIDTDQIAANLYKIKFFGPKAGFVLGSNGVLLRYIE